MVEFAYIEEPTWRRFCKRVGHDWKRVPVYLGGGSYGNAYKLDASRVLKLTSDRSEADAAVLVMRNPDPVVYRVMDVVRMSWSADEGEFKGPGDLAIVQELLQPADPIWREFADSWLDWRNSGEAAPWAPITDANVDRFVAYEGFPATNEERIEWLYRLSAYLAAVGIQFYDLHGANIMKRANGQHCLIDMGTGKVAPQTIPEAQLQIAKTLIGLSDRLHADFHGHHGILKLPDGRFLARWNLYPNSTRGWQDIGVFPTRREAEAAIKKFAARKEHPIEHIDLRTGRPMPRIMPS